MAVAYFGHICQFLTRVLGQLCVERDSIHVFQPKILCILTGMLNQAPDIYAGY